MTHLRPVTLSNLAVIERIHQQYYKNEFTLPDIGDMRKFLSAVVEDDNGKIICAGGIRPIAESIIVTDKSRDIFEKLEALHTILTCHRSLALTNGFCELHAFIQNDDTWVRWLERAGFTPTKGTAYVLDLTTSTV